MNNDMMLQSLTEAFEILKDSWATKGNAIVNCIVETEQYDGSLAMDMWQYVLQNNCKTICLYDVLKRFGCKYAKWTTYEDYCKVYIDHITNHIKNEEFIAIIFGMVIDETDCNIDNDSSVHFLPALVASILLIDKPSLAATLINSMAKNDKLINSSIGNVLTSSQQYVEAVGNHIGDFNKDYKVTDPVKEAMYNSISTISDKETRAECTIAILSF